MLLRGQPIDQPRCLQLSPDTYYVGQVRTEGSKTVRHGLGLQLIMKDTLTGRVKEVSYEGQWEDDLMHGEGKLTMRGGEEYDGEFYRGEANGTGSYRFASGDFYSGSFIDGQMNGEGTYFTAKGDSVDGTFSHGLLLENGVPVPPFLSAVERKALWQRVVEGRVIPIAEVPQPKTITSADSLVELVAEGVRMRRVVLLVRSKGFGGDLESILTTLDQKKAHYLFYSLPDLLTPDKRVEFLFGLRETMENGLLLVLNVDYRAKTRTEFPSFVFLDKVLSPLILARDSQAILQEFSVHGIEPPALIHPEFAIVLLGATRVELGDLEMGEKVCREYPWTRGVGRILLGVVHDLRKPEPFYQTELLDESVNFQNVDLSN